MKIKMASSTKIFVIVFVDEKNTGYYVCSVGCHWPCIKPSNHWNDNKPKVVSILLAVNRLCTLQLCWNQPNPEIWCTPKAAALLGVTTDTKHTISLRRSLRWSRRGNLRAVTFLTSFIKQTKIPSVWHVSDTFNTTTVEVTYDVNNDVAPEAWLTIDRCYLIGWNQKTTAGITVWMRRWFPWWSQRWSQQGSPTVEYAWVQCNRPNGDHAKWVRSVLNDNTYCWGRCHDRWQLQVDVVHPEWQSALDQTESLCPAPVNITV